MREDLARNFGDTGGPRRVIQWLAGQPTVVLHSSRVRRGKALEVFTGTPPQCAEVAADVGVRASEPCRQFGSGIALALASDLNLSWQA